jgi:putative endonuclease
MRNNWRWYVYIIECVDGFYYTGMTWKPDLRSRQHFLGSGSKFTAMHKFKKVVYLEEYDNLDEARRREKQIKGWTRIKKKKLISGEWGKWGSIKD